MKGAHFKLRLVYVRGATAQPHPRGGSGVIFAPETTASSLGVLELPSGDRTNFFSFTRRRSLILSKFSLKQKKYPAFDCVRGVRRRLK